PAPDAGPAAEEPPDFANDPPDFDSAPDAGVAAPPPLRPPPRPLRPDPRLASLDGILVGRELAKNLRLYDGEEVEVVSPIGKETPPAPPPRTRPFRVAGIFFPGMYEYDAKIVYAAIPALQLFPPPGDEVTGAETKLSNSDDPRPVVEAIQAKLGPAYR